MQQRNLEGPETHQAGARLLGLGSFGCLAVAMDVSLLTHDQLFLNHSIITIGGLVMVFAI